MNRRHETLGTVKLRSATAADVPDLVRIEQASFHESGQAFHRRQIAALIANPRAIVTVAIASGLVLGWAVGLLRQHPSRRSGRIYTLAVHPQARGLHLGQRLLEHTLAELHHRGAKDVFLEVQADNSQAIGLYEKLGFVHRRHLRHYYGHGRHGRSMVRRS